MERLKDTRFVFVTGMFRSGTTLLARMLNAHPRIAFASDPYSQLFKTFRNKVSEQVSGAENVDCNAPLDDYYFYSEKQELMALIQSTSLALSVGRLQLSELKEKVANVSRPYSPKIDSLVDDLQGETFADLLVSGLNIVKRAYGSPDTQLLGFKEVWTDEFAGHVLRQFPEAKVIHIIRDPRAVCASKNVKSEKYPWMFLSRQWRKLVTFAWVNSQPSFPFNDRVLVVRFEELVLNPLQEAQRMCEFLNVEFNENMIDPTTFVNGDGKPWCQNSSYFTGKQGFNIVSLEKWRCTLTPKQIQLIELLCFPEMSLWDYPIAQLSPKQIPCSLVFNSPEVSDKELAKWIIPYVCLDKTSLIQEMALEYFRLNVLKSLNSFSAELKKRLALNTEFFDALIQQLTETARKI